MSRTSFPPTWRDILDTKIAGTPVWVSAEKARALDYKYFCHNEQIYAVDSNGYAKTTMVAEDVT